MAGHLSNKTWYNKQRPYVRLNGFGDMIPGSVVFRDSVPKQGTWRQLGFINACCNGIGDSYLIVQNNSTNGMNPGSTIATVTSADGRINFNGDIAQSGGIMVFVIPGGMDEVFTLSLISTATLTDTIDIATSTTSGNGVISAASPANLSGSTIATTFSTTAVPNSQYLVSLSDD